MSKLLQSLLLMIAASLILFYLIHSPSPLYSPSTLSSAQFSRFISDHKKIYSMSEFLFRQQNFEDNLDLILSFNLKGEDFTLAINKFADLNREEFDSLYSENLYEPRPRKLMNVNERLSIPPTEVDWRDLGAVSDVMTQGDCKSSWAAASVAAVEGAMVAQGYLSLVDLSVQQILDCALAEGNGCQGGLLEDAYLYMESNGITTDVIYPYTGMNQSCNTVAAGQPAAFITNWVDVIANEADYVINAISYTPVVAMVEARNYVWQFYAQGVVNGYCGNDISHSVLLVGYNQTAPSNYYIAKNSWGPDWGESGYIRIGIFGGSGVCGVQSLPSYPVFSN